MKSIHYNYILLLLFFLLPVSIFAQATIKGIVIDENNEAAIGANVIITGTSKGTVTEFDGTYIIEDVPAGEISITASYVGYKNLTKTVTVKESGTFTLDFQLGVDTEILNEVVVVGYGTARRRELVGNVSKIESSELSEQVGGTFETALQGKAPGLQLIQGSGSAGSHSIVRIRGVASISAGGDPLYVIDGMILSQDNNYLLGETGGQNNNPLSALNPADIESIEILKDASAAAIYGSRAANGVIIITTKRGKSGKPTFNFSTKIGFGRPTNIVDVLDKDEWIAVQQEAWANNGNVGRFPLPNGLTYEDIEGIDTDWIDLMIRTGVKQEYNFSAKMGNKWISAYGGLTYSNNESYLVNDAFQRTSGRLNLDISPIEKLKINISSSITRGLRDKSEQAWAGGLGWAQSTALPIYPVGNVEFNRDSPKYSPGGWYNIYSNPVAQAYLRSFQTREVKYLNNIQLSFLPTDKLSFTVQGSYDFSDIGDYRLERKEWTTTVPISSVDVFDVKNFSTYGTAEYKILDDEKHSFKVMAGTEYQNFNTQKRYFEQQGLNKQIYELNGFRDSLKTREFQDVYASEFFSVFTRLSYSYQGKYFLQGVFRSDASSKFGKNNRWGHFPSLGLGYIVSEEKFWPKEKFLMNYLKFKASWGFTGNANIPYEEQFSTFSNNPNPDNIDYGNYYNGNTQSQNKEANPDLKWETVSVYDVGLDMGFFDDRITSSLTYYHKLTKDAFLQEQLPVSSGYNQTAFYQNVGVVRNQGVEFEMKTRNLVGKFSWTTDLNIAKNANKVLEVRNATPDALDGGFGDIRVIEGEPVGTNFIIQFSHVDAETGRPVYLDIEGNETFVYDEANRVSAGSILPDFVGGITNSFKYQNFDLGFQFYFQKGGTIYDDAAKRQLGAITNDWNYTHAIFDRWQQPGDVSTYPAFSEPSFWGLRSEWDNNHTLWLYDASFVRLRSLTFGYNIKPKDSSKGFRNIRLYLSGTNLLTFTKYPGWDPEIARGRGSEQERNIGGTNVTYLTPPQEKSFIFGVNLDF